MTISVRASAGLAAFSDTATPFDPQSYTLPAGHTTDDLLLAICGIKPSTTTPDNPSGYTAEADVSTATGQAFGASDAGEIRAMAWYKVDGGAEATPGHTFTVRYSPLMLAMLALDSSNAGSGWTVDSTTGVDNTDTDTSISATGGSMTWATGDMVVVVSAAGSDQSTESSAALSIPGVSLGALTEQLATNTTSVGTDGALYVYTALVTSGGTGAPTFTATSAVATNAHRAVLFLKVTEPSGAANTPPVADAGPDQSGISAGSTVNLDGTGSSDSDGTITTYSWTQTSGTAVTLTGDDTATPSFTAPSGAGETLVFQLEVTDDDADTDTDTVSITVDAYVGPVPPTANAGSDQEVEPFILVTLDGSGSTAAIPAVLTAYAWTQTSGGTVTLTGAATANPTFTSAPAIEGDTLVFLLEVTDDNDETATDTVDVVVRPHTMWLVDTPMQPLRIEYI